MIEPWGTQQGYLGHSSVAAQLQASIFCGGGAGIAEKYSVVLLYVYSTSTCTLYSYCVPLHKLHCYHVMFFFVAELGYL